VLLLLPLLVVPVVVSGISPDAHTHPAFHVTRSNSETQRKFLM
jgi:hypothetical protein